MVEPSGENEIPLYPWSTAKVIESPIFVMRAYDVPSGNGTFHGSVVLPGPGAFARRTTSLFGQKTKPFG